MFNDDPFPVRLHGQPGMINVIQTTAGVNTSVVEETMEQICEAKCRAMIGLLGGRIDTVTFASDGSWVSIYFEHGTVEADTVAPYGGLRTHFLQERGWEKVFKALQTYEPWGPVDPSWPAGHQGPVGIPCPAGLLPNGTQGVP